jgi:predicted nucleic acid-binding protein
VQLADTSAWAWTRAIGGRLRAAFDDAVVNGDIATCAMVRIELLYSTQNGDEFARLREDLTALPELTTDQAQWDRAIEVYALLAQQGGLHHRAVKHPDLLIAAAAEAAEVEILHYDEDYERIAAVTGQATRWLAPHRSVR